MEKVSFPSLEAVRSFVWSELEAAVLSGRHPWHVGVVASLSDQGPRARVVVLRGADLAAGTLVFHTDARSPKAAEIAANPVIEWVFYDAGRGLQLRARASAQLDCGTPSARRAWDAIPDRCLKSYGASAPPGTPQGDGGPGLAPEFLGDFPARDAVAWTAGHFAVVRCEVEALDFLALRAAGHQRARFLRGPAGWDATWLVP